MRIYTTNSTSWDGCDWDAMHNGYHVSVYANRRHHHWIATHMNSWRDHGHDHDHDHDGGMMD